MCHLEEKAQPCYRELSAAAFLLAAHNSGRPVGVGATFDLFQVL